MHIRWFEYFSLYKTWEFNTVWLDDLTIPSAMAMEDGKTYRTMWDSISSMNRSKQSSRKEISWKLKINSLQDVLRYVWFETCSATLKIKLCKLVIYYSWMIICARQNTCQLFIKCSWGKFHQVSILTCLYLSLVTGAGFGYWRAVTSSSLPKPDTRLCPSGDGIEC